METLTGVVKYLLVRSYGSVEERSVHTGKVAGSIPARTTRSRKPQAALDLGFLLVSVGRDQCGESRPVKADVARRRQGMVKWQPLAKLPGLTDQKWVFPACGRIAMFSGVSVRVQSKRECALPRRFWAWINVALITMLGRARWELAWLEKRLLHLAPAGADVLLKEASCSFRQQCDGRR